jgi:hypothetical protein
LDDKVPTYGLLTINHAYNEGKITFHEWLELSREWALAMIEQHTCRAEPRPRLQPTTTEAATTDLCKSPEPSPQ